jgi:transcriptional regulator with XRE-family HTH domain
MEHTTPNRPDSPLRAARVRAGLTQQQLAVKAGLTTGVLSLAERSGYLTKASAEKLAVALGVHPTVIRRGQP